jgi:hypothetical protein
MVTGDSDCEWQGISIAWPAGNSSPWGGKRHTDGANPRFCTAAGDPGKRIPRIAATTKITKRRTRMRIAPGSIVTEPGACFPTFCHTFASDGQVLPPRYQACIRKLAAARAQRPQPYPLFALPCPVGMVSISALWANAIRRWREGRACSPGHAQSTAARVAPGRVPVCGASV